MAMTMSSRAPVSRPRAGTRRRRVPATESEDTSMTGGQHRPSVQFAFLDDALEDSDQTIPSMALGRPPRALMAARRRPELPQTTLITASGVRTKSTFFPDSTDDEESGRGPSVAPVTVRTEPRRLPPRVEANTELLMFPVIHIGDVQFPMTRTVLWDRRVLAGPFPVQTGDVLPRIRVQNAVLRQLHSMLEQNVKHGAKPHSRLLGYLIGRASTDVDKLVVFARLEHQKPDDHKTSLTWVLPVYHGRSPYNEDQERAQQDIVATSRMIYETSGGAYKKFGHGMLPLLGEVFVHLAAGGSRAEMGMEFNLVAPVTSLEFSVIRSLPQLMTPLSASLLRCEFGPDTLRFGFLTLDRARKAVPLLETDPLVLQRPIVGVWVYGVGVDDNTAPNGLRVDDPFLLQSCVRFLQSKVVKERAQVEPSTFLVAVYPGNSPSGPLPRFFECSVKRSASVQTDSSMVAWCPASGNTQCLAGIHSFKGDLELPIVVTTPSPVQVSLVSATLSASTPDKPQGTSFEDNKSAPCDNKASNESILTPSPHLDFDEGFAKAWEPHLRSKSPDCCCSQQLLGTHHQEMLEQQQRQMKEMQEQIAYLQRILTETREENARLLAAASSRYSGSSVGKCEDRQGDSKSVGEVDEPDAPERFEQSQLKEEDHGQDIEDDESVISSLGLSSLSQHSNLSDLSSASLSLVGPRLRQILFTKDEEKGEEINQDTHEECSEEQPVSTIDAQVQAGGGNPDIDSSIEVGTCENGANAQGEKPPVCPYESTAQRRAPKAQCERDEFEEDSDASRVDQLLVERLRIPNTPNREEIVRGGALPTFGFSHGSSFSIPKIKYVAGVVTVDSDDDEEEEIRQIEMKYRKRFVH